MLSLYLKVVGRVDEQVPYPHAALLLQSCNEQGQLYQVEGAIPVKQAIIVQSLAAIADITDGQVFLLTPR